MNRPTYKNGQAKQNRKAKEKRLKLDHCYLNRQGSHPVADAELYGVGARKGRRRGKLRGAAARKERKRKRMIG